MVENSSDDTEKFQCALKHSMLVLDDVEIELSHAGCGLHMMLIETSTHSRTLDNVMSDNEQISQNPIIH